MDKKQELKIGDLVKAADSTVDYVGTVVGLRDGDYVIVQWHGSNRSTHHQRSLELAGQAEMSQ